MVLDWGVRGRVCVIQFDVFARAARNVIGKNIVFAFNVDISCIVFFKKQSPPEKTGVIKGGICEVLVVCVDG